MIPATIRTAGGFYEVSGHFFNFDYTLGDSTQAIVRGCQMGFRALGLEPPTQDQVRPTIGLTLMDGYTQLSGDGDEL